MSMIYICPPCGGTGGGTVVESGPPSVDRLADWQVHHGVTSPLISVEFDSETPSSDLPAGWSWVNQETATFENSLGWGTIHQPAQNGDDWRLLVTDLPSAPFTAEAHFSAVFRNVNWHECGIVLYESSTGKFVMCGKNQAHTASMSRWTNTSLKAGDTATAGAVQTHDFYVRVVYTSLTNVSYYFSTNGIGWFPVTTGQSLSSFFTPNKIGFGANLTMNTAGATSIQWFRVR